MFLPDISADKFTAIRYYSELNPWIDFVVFVEKDREDEAMEKLQMAIDAYWDGHFECYGDAVHDILHEAKIPYILSSHDPDDESDEYSWWWRVHMARIEQEMGMKYLEN